MKKENTQIYKKEKGAIMNRKIYMILLAILIINIGIGLAGAVPVEQWNKLYSCSIGGFTSCDSIAESVQQISDGSIVLAGYNSAYGTGIDTYREGWLRKTNAYGTLLWTRIYTEPFQDYTIHSVRQTSTGYILAGVRHDSGTGQSTALIIRTDTNGNKIWAKGFGGGNANYAEQTSDGNYVLTGQATGSGAWLYKFNSLGNKIWEKKYPDTSWATTVRQTRDGGYILTGSGSIAKSFLLKTDANGNKVWIKTFGGYDSGGNYVQQTTDGGYIITGTTFTYGENYGDGWAIKTDANGNKLWERIFASNVNDDYMYSGQETKDGGFIFAGDTHDPLNGKSCDAWIIKTSKLGSVQWNKKIGGTQCDVAKSIQQTKDLGFIFVGTKGSNAWLQKLIEPYITVVYPNGGEAWTKGSTRTIKWSSIGVGGYVKIELLKGAYVNRVISSGTPNDGSHNWYVPSTQAYGTDYKIRITSTYNSIYKDVSNNNFKIY